MFRQILLCWLYFFALTPSLTYGMTEEQKNKIHEEFTMLGMECIKEYVISENDINDLRSRKLPSGEKVPCFLACMMKKAGIMDEEGMLQNEKALEKARNYFDDEEEIKKIEEYLHSCCHINTESVSDGAMGCERAYSAYKCMTENASQFGFEM